jgi:hypothetical protein
VGGVAMWTFYNPIACWSSKLQHCTLFEDSFGPVV